MVFVFSVLFCFRSPLRVVGFSSFLILSFVRGERERREERGELWPFLIVFLTQSLMILSFVLLSHLNRFFNPKTSFWNRFFNPKTGFWSRFFNPKTGFITGFLSSNRFFNTKTGFWNRFLNPKTGFWTRFFNPTTGFYNRFFNPQTGFLIPKPVFQSQNRFLEPNKYRA